MPLVGVQGVEKTSQLVFIRHRLHEVFIICEVNVVLVDVLELLVIDIAWA